MLKAQVRRWFAGYSRRSALLVCTRIVHTMVQLSHQFQGLYTQLLAIDHSKSAVMVPAKSIEVDQSPLQETIRKWRAVQNARTIDAAVLVGATALRRFSVGPAQLFNGGRLTNEQVE